MATPIQTSTGFTMSSGATSTSGTSALGKDDFLKLLMAQMQYQNPLEPMSGTEFATQLAQFSSVEQLTNINSTLEQSLTANQVLAQGISNAMATTLIGKEVRASGNEVSYDGTSSVSVGYNLAKDAGAVNVKIYDASGTLVRTITNGGRTSGDNKLTWDGRDENGAQVASGKYTFKVDATDAAGASVTATTSVYGTITGVRFKTDGAYFVVDGVEIPLSSILEIQNG